MNKSEQRKAEYAALEYKRLAIEISRDIKNLESGVTALTVKMEGHRKAADELLAELVAFDKKYTEETEK